MDRISSLPDNLIGLILEKLPIIDRVRTSALSSSWRLKWTFLSSLALDYNFFCSVPSSVRYALEYANMVNNLLLQHAGSLREFCLCVPSEDQGCCSLFQHSVTYVMKSSRSSLERLSLEVAHIPEPFASHSSIFFVANLRHLNLKVNKCEKFNPPSWFEGFPNLTHFELQEASTAADAISHLVSVCPQIEEVRLENVTFVGQNLHLKAPKLSGLLVAGEYIDISVSNPQTLEAITVSFYSLDREDASRSADRFNFLTNSLQLQAISLCGWAIEAVGYCRFIHMLPTFSQLHRLSFIRVALNYPIDLQCFLSFCACSPNVEDLELMANPGLLTQETSSLELEAMCEKYIKKDLGKLARVDMTDISGTTIELKIIKLLLCFSPTLEVMDIVISSDLSDGDSWEARQSRVATVVNFYRASPKAKICITDDQRMK